MTHQRLYGKFLPTKEQELLIKASLLDGKEAIEAWQEYGASVNTETIDPGSQRILPLLYQNLKKLNIDAPSMNFLKGVYRNTWYRNETIFRAVKPVLKALHEGGIKTMILKGGALAQIYYSDHALRPMSDFDLLIPTSRIFDAIKVLQKLEFTPQIDIAMLDSDYLFRTHAIAFHNAQGYEIDLHWHAIHECKSTTADDVFWKNSVNADIYEVSSYILSPTHQLIHVCLHGAKVNRGVPPIRWVPDAIMIMRQSKIDWNQLLSYVKENNIIIPIRETLDYLIKIFHAPIPSYVIDALKDMYPKKIELIEYNIRNRRSGFTYPFYYHASRFMRYMNSKYPENNASYHTVAEIFNYLKYTWNIKNVWLIPYYVVQKSLKRIVFVKTYW